MESIFSDMPTVGFKKRTFKRVPDQTVLWVVSYPRKLWTPGEGALILLFFFFSRFDFVFQILNRVFQILFFSTGVHFIYEGGTI